MDKLRYIVHMFPFCKESSEYKSEESLDNWADTEDFIELFDNFVQVCVRPLYRGAIVVESKPVFIIGEPTECEYGWYTKNESVFCVPFTDSISMTFSASKKTIDTGEYYRQYD